MNNVKERLFGAITVMNEVDAQKLWDFVQHLYGDWDVIEKVEPDSIDLQMIQSAQIDPDCRTFATDEEVRAALQ